MDLVGADTVTWLLEDDVPAVRAAALVRLLDRAVSDRDVVQARTAAMQVDPIRAILNAQEPAGYWVKPGPGYSPKYRGTVWQLIFLDQLGADPGDDRVQRACDYVLAHAQAGSGGMGYSGAADRAPTPSSVVHCLNGNLVRALIGFGRLADPRVQAALEWAARAITGQGVDRYYASGTSGPGFACAANDGRSCAWGAVKEMLAVARVPVSRRSGLMNRAVAAGVEFLLSVDPATADYPTPAGDTGPSGMWFKLGFPSAYVTDVLQNLEVLAELGYARDPRVAHGVDWLLGQRTGEGRWLNRHAYNAKTTVDVERQGAPSKWVTLRACTVLKAALD